jgi:triosephosphate isomerase (TIM)
MRKKIVAGNWKMNNTHFEGMKLVSEIANMVQDEVSGDVKVILIPSFIHLYSIGRLIEGKDGISLGAQNCYSEPSGAYTGEISVPMLKSVGAEYVLVGHSERRQYFFESNELLRKKVDISLENQVTPILCCGEKLEDRNSGRHFEIVRTQLEESLFHLSAEKVINTVIAYEPVWAIGTGVNASPDQAQEMHALIRELLSKRYTGSVAAEVSILYGGSCNPKNASELFAREDVDGGLIGGASLKSRDFTDILKSF